MTSSFTPVGSMAEEMGTPRSAEAQTWARSRLCSLLGRAFAFPDGALYQELTGGAWEREVAETVVALPFPLNLADLSLAPSELTKEGFEAEYVRLFEVGRGPGGCVVA